MSYKVLNNKYILYDNGIDIYRISSINKIQPLAINYAGKKNYTYKTISINGKSRVYLHRVMWEAFNGKIPSDKVVDHINGDRLDNRLSNLSLLSREENSRKTINQTIKKTKKNGWYKPICNIRTGKKYKSIKEWVINNERYNGTKSKYMSLHSSMSKHLTNKKGFKTLFGEVYDYTINEKESNEK